MKYIDLHADTLSKLWLHGERDLGSNNLMLDLEKMEAGGVLAQFFAIFMQPENRYPKLPPERLAELPEDLIGRDEAYIAALEDIMLGAIKQYPERIALARNYADLLENESKNRISAFLTLEDGRAVQGSFENLNRFYEKGVRLISLTWNYANCFGFPNSREPEEMARGLTAFGFEAIPYMQEKGILVDVSHLSDGGFWDLIKIAKKPLVASHSNSRALSPHPRNLTDEMLKALGAQGGIAGLNFCPAFVHESPVATESRLDRLVLHLRYMIDKGGEDLVALGTDFDGITGDLELGTARDIPRLFEALAKAGLSARQIEKIAHENARRVLKDCLK